MRRCGKYIGVLILFLICAIPTYAGCRWALVIGISNYPKQSGWAEISGANDMDIIIPRLREYGFETEHIITLKNELATKENIESAITRLCNQLNKGDIVYLHFSGHGQLISDINGDEIDGWDEAIIPYDAHLKYEYGIYEGGNHIIDDELNEWLNEIKSRIGKIGQLIVVLDACHSGGGSRAIDDNVIIRGSSDKFILPHNRQDTNRKSTDINWVCISACKSYQNNYECKIPHMGSVGRLSYVLSRLQLGGQTVEELERLIISEYNSLPSSYPQDPDIEYGSSLKHTKIF